MRRWVCNISQCSLTTQKNPKGFVRACVYNVEIINGPKGRTLREGFLQVWCVPGCVWSAALMRGSCGCKRLLVNEGVRKSFSFAIFSESESPPGLHTNLHLKYLELQNKYLSFQQFGVWINNMERLCRKDTLRFSVVMLCGRVFNIMAFCCRFWVTRNFTGFWKKNPLTNSACRHRGRYPCIRIKCNCCNKHHLSHELSSMVLLPLQK